MQPRSPTLSFSFVLFIPAFFFLNNIKSHTFFLFEQMTSDFTFSGEKNKNDKFENSSPGTAHLTYSCQPTVK